LKSKEKEKRILKPSCNHKTENCPPPSLQLAGKTKRRGECLTLCSHLWCNIHCDVSVPVELRKSRTRQPCKSQQSTFLARCADVLTEPLRMLKTVRPVVQLSGRVSV
jgi:hypothetical protein